VQGQVDALTELGHTFDELPGVMEPAVENMQEFIAAQEHGVQAALEFARMLSDAYDDMLSTLHVSRV
jgi:hypothetical protein